MKTVAFHNLGCKVNDYEMDIMQQKFTENDFLVVPFDQKADVYVINTCTVTNIADRKSRQMLHRAKKENPDSVVIAVGCYVQTSPDAAAKDECIDIAIGNNRKADIIDILNRYYEEKEHKTCSDIIDINKTDVYESMFLEKTAERTRAYIKIQDGCNQFCSYCLIPFARGRSRSRDMEDILKEIDGLSKAGYKEFVLTGIHVSSYGVSGTADFKDNRLADLLEAINELPGVLRIRLSSLEPRVMTEEFVKRISALEKLCPHFHLSLQSGCDETLKRMNRHYTAEEYRKGVELLRKYFDDPAITTDVIAGFPGETEADFEACYEFVKSIGFYETHIFKYSRRKGTVADRLPDQLTDAEKTKRSHRLIELTKENSKAFRESYLGKTRPVLFEERAEVCGKEYLVGHTPEYIRVCVDTSEVLENEIREVSLSKLLDDENVLGFV